MEKAKSINWGQDFFVHHRTVSAVKGIEFSGDRMYVVTKGGWCKVV
jgi:hypothetical protein